MSRLGHIHLIKKGPHIDTSTMWTKVEIIMLSEKKKKTDKKEN